MKTNVLADFDDDGDTEMDGPSTNKDGPRHEGGRMRMIMNRFKPTIRRGVNFPRKLDVNRVVGKRFSSVSDSETCFGVDFKLFWGSESLCEYVLYLQTNSCGIEYLCGSVCC